MPVKKTSHSSSTRGSRPFEKRADGKKQSERGRAVVKIVPEPQPTPADRPVPAKEILRRRRPKNPD